MSTVCLCLCLSLLHTLNEILALSGTGDDWVHVNTRAYKTWAPSGTCFTETLTPTLLQTPLQLDGAVQLPIKALQNCWRRLLH